MEAVFINMTKQSPDESAELNIDNYYKNAKLELESMFSEHFGKDFISLRVSNLFGSPYHKSDVGFVDNLIKKDNSKFKIPTIADTKDWVHADEVSRVLDELLSHRTKPSGVFNVGTGISYEITNITEFRSKRCNYFKTRRLWL